MCAKQVIELEIQFDTGAASQNAVELNKQISDLTTTNKELSKAGQKNTIEYQKNTEAIKLNKTQLQQTNKTINDNKLATKAATGSIEEQRKRLSVLTDQWKRQGTTTEAGRKRQAALANDVRKLTDDLKKQEKAVGNTTRNVGNYNQSVGESGAILSSKLSPGLAGAATGFGAMTKAALAFIATPIGAVIAALGLAFVAIKTALTGSAEGQEKFAKGMAAISSVMGNLVDLVIEAGEFLIGLFENPQKALKDFGDLIKNNITTRIDGLLTLIPSLGKAFSLVFEGNFKAAGKVAADAVGKVALGIDSITDVIESAGDAISDFADEVVSDMDKAIAAQEGLNESIRLTRELTVDQAKATRDQAALRLKAAQEDKFSLQERIDFLNEAQVIEDEISAKRIRQAQLELSEIQVRNTLASSTIEDLQLEAEAQAKLINLETQRTQTTLKFETFKQGLIKRDEAEREKEFARQEAADEADVARNEKVAKQKADDSIKAQKLASEEIVAILETEFAQKQKIANNVAKISAFAAGELEKGTLLQKSASISSIIASTFSASAAALTPPPLGLGPIAGVVPAALAIASGLSGISKVVAAASGDMWTFGQGGKSGVFSGKPHSSGGTKGMFDDGTRVEVEKDEAFIVVNKRDTPLLNHLNDINSIHGKSFMESGGSLFMQDGGAASRFVSNPVSNSLQQAAQLRAVIDSLPNPVVFVSDIRTGVGNVVQVEDRASA